MQKLKKLFCSAGFLFAVLAAAALPVFAQTVELNYDFRSDAGGWTAGFAEYNPNVGSGYDLFAGLRYLPRKATRVPVRGFYIQGNNNSADLFMFLKRRLGVEDGIVANRTYNVEYVVSFASEAATGCIGIGSPPGEGVYLKVGASSIEPLAVLQPNGGLTMNVDKGNQSQGGTAASVAGDIANGIDCEDAFPYFPFTLVERVHTHTTAVTASSNGELWLLVGTDSGFEGRTRLYYKSIKVRLIPS